MVSDFNYIGIIAFAVLYWSIIIYGAEGMNIIGYIKYGKFHSLIERLVRDPKEHYSIEPKEVKVLVMKDFVYTGIYYNKTLKVGKYLFFARSPSPTEDEVIYFIHLPKNFDKEIPIVITRLYRLDNKNSSVRKDLLKHWNVTDDPDPEVNKFFMEWARLGSKQKNHGRI